MIQRLSQDEGINLEGIRRIMAMESEIEHLQRQVRELSDLLAASRAAPPGSRVFTADPGGDVRLGRTARPSWVQRALPGPSSR